MNFSQEPPKIAIPVEGKPESEEHFYERVLSPRDPSLSDIFLKVIDKPSINNEDKMELLSFHQKIKDLEKLAMTDMLTGLPNRVEFHKALDWLFAINSRRDNEKVKFSLVAFDLDGFKAVNDSFGHEAGDKCLQLVASEVGTVVRSSDVFAREGGDEFLILLPDVGDEGAQILAEKVFMAITNSVTEKLKVMYPGNGGISASIGVVTYKTDSENNYGNFDKNDLVKYADYVRYMVKAAGKKGILTYEEARKLDEESGNEYWKAYIEGKHID